MISPLFSALRQVIYDAPCNGRIAAVASYIPLVNGIFFLYKSIQYLDSSQRALDEYDRDTLFNVHVYDEVARRDACIVHLKKIVVLEVYMRAEQQKAHIVIVALLILKAIANRSISFAIRSVVGYSLLTILNNRFVLNADSEKQLISPGPTPGPDGAYREAYETLGWPVPEQYR